MADSIAADEEAPQPYRYRCKLYKSKRLSHHRSKQTHTTAKSRWHPKL